MVGYTALHPQHYQQQVSHAICLRACDAMSGTECVYGTSPALRIVDIGSGLGYAMCTTQLAHGAISYATQGTELRYGPSSTWAGGIRDTRRNCVSSRISLPASYPISRTSILFERISLPASYPISRTIILFERTSLPASYPYLVLSYCLSVSPYQPPIPYLVLSYRLSVRPYQPPIPYPTLQ
eukprot:664235-Rhodomonas_salina.3